MIRLVCTGPKRFPHRKVVILETDHPQWRSGGSASLELHCRRCHRAPRPGLTIGALLLLAQDGGGELDIGRQESAAVVRRPR